MDYGLHCDALEQGIYEAHEFDGMLLIPKPLFIHSRADHRRQLALFQICHVEVESWRLITLHHLGGGMTKSLGLEVTCIMVVIR